MIKTNPNEMWIETIERGSHKISKSVSFLGTVIVHPYLHKNNFTDEEKNACWISEKEMSHIKNDIRETIQFLCESVIVTEGNSDICSRGLEMLMPNEGTARRNRRREAVKAVLDEQDAQSENNEPYNHDLIAETYQQFTISSLSIAKNMAQEDEQFVLEEQAKET